MQRSSIWVNILTLSVIIGMPLLVLLIGESIVRDIFDQSVRDWYSKHPKLFWLNYLIIFALINIFYILPRKLFFVTTFLISALIGIFALANKFKLELRSTPITPDDFQLLDELTGFEFPVEINWVVMSLGLIGVFGLFYILFKYLPNTRELWMIKFFLPMFSILFLYSLWNDEPFSPMREAGVQSTMWKLEVAMKANGILANVINLSKVSEVPPLDSYTEEKIQIISKQYAAEEDSQSNHPNVVFIMSEAFMDPYMFGEDLFTKDPVPNFRNALSRSQHGVLYTPEFGGGTANVEFEAVTGMSMQFLRPDHVVYQQFIDNPIPSLPYILKQEGYSATAVHAYFAWYYRRDTVYKRLGFDRFISGEFMDLDTPNTIGGQFPKDKHMTDSIIATIEESDGPDFVHAVSVEAHMPYGQLEVPTYLKPGQLEKETESYLNAYLEKINSVDRELGRLLEYFNDLEERTILVFWGDHLPAFPSGDVFYGPEGIDLMEDRRGNYSDFITSHEVPYFIWDSEISEVKEQNISPSFIPSLVLERINIPGNTITEIQEEIMMQGYERIPYSSWPKDEKKRSEQIGDFEFIQYDWLHGRQYEQTELTPNPNYHLGLFSEIKVVKQNLSANNYSIIVEGAPKFTTVEINGKEITSYGWQRLNTRQTIYTFSDKILAQGDEVVFKVINSRNKALKSSKSYKIN